MNEQEKIYTELKENVRLENETEIAEEAYRVVPYHDRKKLSRCLQKWFELFCATQQHKINVIRIFSPIAAKTFERRLKTFAKETKRKLGEEYWKELRNQLPEQELNKFTKEILDQSIMFGHLLSGDTTTAFIVINDTLHHVGVRMTGSSKENEIIESIVKSSINPIVEQFRKFAGHYEYFGSFLLEKEAEEFYRNKGFEIKSSPQYDQKYKTDFVAIKGNESIAVQVKKGQVSIQEINEISECADALLQKDFKNSQKKAIHIIAKEFPTDILRISDEFKNRSGIDLQFYRLPEVSKRLKRAGL